MGKIAYLHQGGRLPEELEKRQKFLSSLVDPKNKIVFKSGKSKLSPFRSVPEICRLALEAENEGYDILVLGCASGPGFDAICELVKIPVVHPEMASSWIALLGRSFSVLTDGPKGHRNLKKSVFESLNLASKRGIGMSTGEIRVNRDKSINAVVEEEKKALKEDMVEVIVLGCMSLAFQNIDKEVQEKLRVPVVDSLKSAVKMAEMLTDLNLPTASKLMETIHYNELR